MHRPITSQAQLLEAEIQNQQQTRSGRAHGTSLAINHRLAMEDSDAHVELNPKPSAEDIESNAPTPMSDVTEAGTKRRSTLDDDNEEPIAESAAKRRRTEHYGLQTPPAEDIIQAVLDTRPVFNDEPSNLLRRATALVLEHVGFDSATKEAIESLCGEVDSC